LWKSFWVLAKKPGLVNFLLKLLYPLVAPGLLNLFKTCRPDVIVSVHPLFTLYPLAVLKRAKLNTPFITVVTDLVSGYPTWYHPQTTLCLVSTEAARTQALSLGIPPKKIEVFGQPVALKFATGIGEKSCLRSKLGLDPNRPVALLAGGAEGYGHILEIARCIAGRVSSAQLIIVAGRNELLRKKLEAVNWEIPTTIFGFVPNMHELMGAADIFITKAGPNSICEAFIAKLPVVLFDYIPCQEEGNVQYVLSHNAGVYVPNSAMIADLLLDWLQPDNSALTEMTRKASSLAHPEAALAIARRAYELIPQVDRKV
jgi:1,2-diacylglycerol 3-beta-galactosyltransferase